MPIFIPRTSRSPPVSIPLNPNGAPIESVLVCVNATAASFKSYVSSVTTSSNTNCSSLGRLPRHAGSLGFDASAGGSGWFVCTLRNTLRSSFSSGSRRANPFFVSAPVMFSKVAPSRVTLASTRAALDKTSATSTEGSETSIVAPSSVVSVNANSPSFFGKPNISRPAIMLRSLSTSIHGQCSASTASSPPPYVTSNTIAASWYAPQQNESGYHAMKTVAARSSESVRRFLGSHAEAAAASATRAFAASTSARFQPNLLRSASSASSAASASSTSSGAGQDPGPNGAAMRVRCTRPFTSGDARAASSTFPSHGHDGSEARARGRRVPSPFVATSRAAAAWTRSASASARSAGARVMEKARIGAYRCAARWRVAREVLSSETTSYLDVLGGAKKINPSSAVLAPFQKSTVGLLVAPARRRVAAHPPRPRARAAARARASRRSPASPATRPPRPREIRPRVVDRSIDR
eukprot:29612-Pelagococcus_subviridis.AAC.2